MTRHGIFTHGTGEAHVVERFLRGSKFKRTKISVFCPRIADGHSSGFGFQVLFAIHSPWSGGFRIRGFFCAALSTLRPQVASWVTVSSSVGRRWVERQSRALRLCRQFQSFYPWPHRLGDRHGHQYDFTRSGHPARLWYLDGRVKPQLHHVFFLLPRVPP